MKFQWGIFALVRSHMDYFLLFLARYPQGQACQHTTEQLNVCKYRQPIGQM